MVERVVTCCKATDGVILFIFTASNNKVNFGIKCLFKLSIVFGNFMMIIEKEK
jgi:hypothetical protein